ncbi:MAG: S1 RNA-binding domain-containing protein [Oscillospiraceae bacterium]|nr:S1 RNA-binding domain-containing protein [Oscillospiraceae bacterium]
MNIYKPEGWLIDTQENQKALKTLASLQQAYRERRILEARAIICDSKHDLHVDLGCMTGVIPREEGALGIADGTVRDIAVISRVNKAVCFYIEGFGTAENGRGYAILSRRAVQEDCRREYIAKLTPGDVIDCRVTHLEPFGAFADIGCGIPSLLPIDMISVSRITHPDDRFTVGMNIKCIVKGIEEDGKVSLTHKELLGTWKQNAALFKAGETVAGVVRSVESYGIFVELTPNLAGLAESHPGVYVGQQACVYVKSILEDKMKVKLVLIDTFDEAHTPELPKYFFTGVHMDSFKYSPEEAEKQVEIFF